MVRATRGGVVYRVLSRATEDSRRVLGKQKIDVLAAQGVSRDDAPLAGGRTSAVAEAAYGSERRLLGQSDDVDAFAALFERYEREIYNYCFRNVGDWATAEDLTSIVFLEAWRRRDAIFFGAVRAWLYGIATNVIRNRKRSERRFRAALTRIPADVRTPNFADDAESRIDDERSMRLILATVNQLPRHEREVLALCVWSNLSYEDAASALGVPTGTVRSRLSRAKQHLLELQRHVREGS